MGSSALTNKTAPPCASCASCWRVEQGPTVPPPCKICCGTRRRPIPPTEVMRGMRRGTLMPSDIVWRGKNDRHSS